MTQEDHILLMKTEKILRNNIYELDEKYPWYPYRMVCPDKKYFPGIWNWDSAFHAIGFLDIDAEIAKEQILGFTKFQSENGIFADLIAYADGLNNELTKQYPDGFIEYRYTKPPVLADAAWQVYEKTNDLLFLKDVYGRFVNNEKFWIAHRKKDGLFHYDADKSEGEEMRRIWVGYESGMDNSPRWDTTPYFYYAIDLNCYMVKMYRALKKMADVLGDDSTIWSYKEDELAFQIENRLWNDSQGVYNDFNYQTDSFGKVLTPVCFLPMYIGISSKEHASRCAEVIAKHFMPGIPTVAYDDPCYSLDYWRGPCWLNFAYFVAKGLKNYGYDDYAQLIKNTVLNWVINDGEYIHENYDAKTGKGLCQQSFSWSAVFVRKFIKDF